MNNARSARLRADWERRPGWVKEGQRVVYGGPMGTMCAPGVIHGAFVTYGKPSFVFVRFDNDPIIVAINYVWLQPVNPPIREEYDLCRNEPPPLRPTTRRRKRQE